MHGSEQPTFEYLCTMNMRSTLRISLPLLLAGGILWWMYRGMDWASISAALRHGMHWEWMLASLPFGILAQMLRAMRWQQLLHPMGERLRLHTAINAVFLSYASSLVVPRVGEVLRCGVLHRYDGVSFSRSVGTVVTERVIDMILIAVLSLLTFLTQVPVFSAFFERTGVNLCEFLRQFTATGYVVTAICGAVVAATAWLLIRHLKLFARTRSAVGELTQGLLSVRHVQGKWLFWLYSIGIWVSYYLHFYIAFFSFDATSGLGAMAALVAFVVGTFAVLVPTPNGAGPWHFAVKTVLMLYGVPNNDGALFVLIVHAIQTALVALMGVYSLAALALTHKRTS